MLAVFIPKETNQNRTRISILAFSDAMNTLKFYISCLPVATITFQEGSENFFSIFIAATNCCRFLYVGEFDIPPARVGF